MNPLAALFGGKQAGKIISIIVLVIVLFVVGQWLYKKINKRNVGKQFVDTSALNPNVNYDNVAKAVHDAFDNWINSGSEEEKVCKQLNGMNNNELKHINNRYVSLYGKGTRTLQDAVTDYYLCVGCSNCVALADRLETILIN